ncbi:MAG: hypothetical protein LBJ18_03565 [Rickettsiales bacterium]|jgi:hypothetical protein|nr:hypothetical protein [Rickettsiales bacterium]
MAGNAAKLFTIAFDMGIVQNGYPLCHKFMSRDLRCRAYNNAIKPIRIGENTIEPTVSILNNRMTIHFSQDGIIYHKIIPHPAYTRAWAVATDCAKCRQS